MSHPNKSFALGMNFSTARSRLERDLLVKLALAAGHKCYRCGGELERGNFSVDHKKPWLKQTDPKTAFFDLGNVAFSHIYCNVREMAERRTGQTKYPEFVGLNRSPARLAWEQRRVHDPVERHERYLRNGK